MIRSLQHVAMTVPDLDAGQRFYERFGLIGNTIGNDLVFRCDGRAQDQLRLIEGARKKLAYVSFGTANEELPQVQRRLEAQGTRIESSPVKELGDGIWFRDPDGDLINLRAAMESPARSGGSTLNHPGDYKRLAARGVALDDDAPVRPRRLGHLIKFTTDVDRSIAFYTAGLGMKLSDRVQDKIAFLRCGNDGDHHVLGVALAPGTGLHHLSFEVGSVEEIERGAQHLLAAGYKDAYGLGRHVLGSNYFHYVRDPWMSLVEYFWDIDYIPEGASWESANVGLGPRAISQWAVMPVPEDFTRNYEID